MSSNQNKNTAKYNKNQNKNQNQNKVPLSSKPEVIPWNNSIFIPAIPFAVTKNQLKEAMESNLGTVHRIDFATFNSDNGTGRRAFVHFDHTYQTDFTKVLRQEIAQKGHFDVYYPMYKMNLRIMMNKNPVPETDKTIHQVASEIDFIGEKIRLHEETFLLMQDRMNEMYEDNKAMKEKNQALEEENKAMKQYMENMFYRVESLWGDVQLLHLMPMPMPMPVFYPMMPMPMPMPMPDYYHQIPMDSNVVEEGYPEVEENPEPEVEEEVEYPEEEEREEGEEYESDDNDNYCQYCDARLPHKGYALCDMCEEKGDRKKRYMKKGKMELSELM